MAATLAALRRAGGDDAVRKALERALREHPTRADAARSLGIDVRNLARTARRVGLTLPRLPAGRPKSA